MAFLESFDKKKIKKNLKKNWNQHEYKDYISKTYHMHFKLDFSFYWYYYYLLILDIYIRIDLYSFFFLAAAVERSEGDRNVKLVSFWRSSVLILEESGQAEWAINITLPFVISLSLAFSHLHTTLVSNRHTCLCQYRCNHLRQKHSHMTPIRPSCSGFVIHQSYLESQLLNPVQAQRV